VAKTIAKNVVINTAITFINIAYPFFVLPWVLRVLQPESIGIVNWAQSFVGYFTLLASLGIPLYAVRETARRQSSRKSLELFFSNILILSCLSALVCFGVYCAVVFLVPAFAAYRLLFVIAGLTIILNAFSIDWFFVGTEQFAVLLKRNIVIKAIGLVATYVFIRSPADYVLYVLITIFSLSGSNVWNLVIVFRRYTLFRVRVGLLSLLRLVKKSSVMFSINIVLTISQNIAVTLMGFFGGYNAVGQYSTTYKIFQVFMTLSGAIFGVLMPRLTATFGEGKEDDYHADVTRYLNYIMIIVVYMSVFAFIMGEPFIMVFSGEKYRDSVWMLMIIAPVIMISGVSASISYILYFARKKEKIVLAADIVSALVTFATLALLWSRIGIVVAPLSFLLSEISLFIVLLVFMEKGHRKTILNADKLIILASGALVGGLLAALRLLQLPDLVLLAAGGLVSLAAYVALLVFVFRFGPAVQLFGLLSSLLARKARKQEEP
jgi:O-antigen/teichoic acid export membrane protein